MSCFDTFFTQHLCGGGGKGNYTLVAFRACACLRTRKGTGNVGTGCNCRSFVGKRLVGFASVARIVVSCVLSCVGNAWVSPPLLLSRSVRLESKAHPAVGLQPAPPPPLRVAVNTLRRFRRKGVFLFRVFRIFSANDNAFDSVRNWYVRSMYVCIDRLFWSLARSSCSSPYSDCLHPFSIPPLEGAGTPSLRHSGHRRVGVETTLALSRGLPEGGRRAPRH